MKFISIVQPHFIPWIGFFDLINKSDKFIFLDCVKFPHGKSFIRRNNIINSHLNIEWISIPITSKQKNLLIKDVKIDESFNKLKILNTFKKNFLNNKYFDESYFLLEKILSNNFNFISDLNIYSTKLICNYLDIKTEFYLSSKMQFSDNKNKLLISIIKNFNEKLTYISGEGGKLYLDKKLFLESDYKIKFMDYNFKYNNVILKNYQCSILQLISIYGKKVKYMLNSKLVDF